jgi:hypothetical protein
MSSHYLPVTFVEFKEARVFSTDFNEPVTQHKTSRKLVRWQPGCSMRTNGRTDGQTWQSLQSLFATLWKHLNISKRTVLSKVWGVKFRTAVHQWRGRIWNCGNADEGRWNFRLLKIQLQNINFMCFLTVHHNIDLFQ